MERDGPAGVTRVLQPVQAELVAHVGDIVGLGLGRALLDHGALCRRVGALLNLVGPVKPDLKKGEEKLVSGSGFCLDRFSVSLFGRSLRFVRSLDSEDRATRFDFRSFDFFVLLQRFFRPFADSSVDIDLLFDDFFRIFKDLRKFCSRQN